MSIWKRGLVYSFAIIFNRLIPAWAVRVGYWRVSKLDLKKLLSCVSSQDGGADIQVRLAVSPGEIVELSRVTGADEQSTLSRNGVMVLSQEKVVGGVWLGEKCFDEKELGLTVSLKGNQLWLYSASIEKEHREQGLYKACLRYVAEQAETTSHDTVLFAVNPFNKRSVAAHQTYASRVGNIIVFRILRVGIAVTFGDVCLRKVVTLDCVQEPFEILVDS